MPTRAPTSSSPSFSAHGELRRRLTWLMVGRLLVATLLLGGTLALAINHEQGARGYTARFLLSMILATYAISLAFAVWLPRSRSLDRFGSIQIGWDVGLTTALVYASGGAASGFTFLYGISVLMAALVVGPRAAQLATAVALVFYSGLSLALVSGLLPPPLDQPSERYLMSGADASFTILVNILGLLLIAVLATTLAQRLRRTGGQLREATAQAAGLAKLNESIIRSLSSGLLTTDLALRIRTINPAGLAILRTPPDQVLDRPLDAHFPAAALAHPGHVRAEGRGTRADGSEFPIGYTKTDLLDGAGERTGDLLVFQDLTEITELREAAERAERHAALGRVAAALAHEIRNPLGAISGSVELVAESPHLLEEDRHLLSVVAKEVDRLNQLVHTMLDLSRPTQPARVRQDVVALAQEVVQIARRDQVVGPQMELALDAPDAPVVAPVDGAQVRQLLWNLVKNAVQHSPREGQVVVRVRDDDPWVRLEVSDQGPGVPPHAREQLFDMFYSKREHGIGLGLALCKQIVEAHGGDIDVQPAGPRGSRFIARFLAQPAAG